MKGKDVKKIILKNWLRYRDRWNSRIYNKFAIALFGGLHPKNVFNYRYEFFVENVTKDDVVIDIGCGTGLILYKIAPFISRGYGIDNSRYNISVCRNKHNCDNIEYIEEDIFNIDYVDLRARTGFNTLILSHILEHIKDVPAFLKKSEARKLLICVPSQENWEMQLKKHLGIRYFTDDTHFREYTREMLSAEIEQSGYHVESIGFNPEAEIICKAVRK